MQHLSQNSKNQNSHLQFSWYNYGSGGEREYMLKVVVFDCGYGGEFFADKLAEELPILDIIRVVDWRHAADIQSNPRLARKYTEQALRPYIGRAELIIFANHFLTATSLKYFRRKYKDQKFIGLRLKRPNSPIKRDTLILATKAITRTVNYYNFLFHIDRKSKALTLDTWPAQIDDGELTKDEVRLTLEHFIAKSKLDPGEIILACSHFSDLKPTLRSIFGCTVKIYDSTEDAISEACKALNIRGGTGKKSK